MRLITTVLLSALCLGFLASHASAEASAVVLGLRSVEGDDDFANALTNALRASAREVSGWKLLDRSVSMAQMSLAHGCDEIDAACLNEIAKGLSVARVVYGTVRRTSARSEYDYQLSVSIFDADTGAIGATETDIIPRAESQDSSAVNRRAASLMQRLTMGAGSANAGTLAIHVNVPTAEVRIDGQMVGQTRDQNLLVENVPPGEHTLEITAIGRGTYSQQVMVAPTGQTHVIAALGVAGESAAPGSEEREAAPLATQEYAEPKKPASLRWLGYTLVGVSAASLVGVAASWMVLNGINNDATYKKYRDVVNQDIPDICVEAQRGNKFGDGITTGVTPAQLKDVQGMCRTGGTFEVLQWVFLGTAIVSGGVGAYVLVTDKPSERSIARRQPRFALSPRVGRGSFGLSTTLRF
jgi:hypothetical protein